MSGRPTRSIKQPNRLTMQPRPTPRKKKPTATKGGVQKNPMQATGTKKRQSKKDDIIKLILSKNVNKRDKYLMKLASLYHLMEETQIKRDFSSDENVLEMIDKQTEAIKKSTLNITPKKYKFIFENDEIRLGFLVLMWLDMSHDKTVVKGFKQDKSKTPIYYTLKEFLELNISKKLIKKTPTIKITGFISRLIDIGAIKQDNIDIKLNPGFEKKIKSNFENLFELKDVIRATSGESIATYLKNGINNPIYISIDQESDKLTPISDLIIKSKYEIKKNNGSKKSFYAFNSLITLANIIDPGAFGNKMGLIRDASHLFDIKDTRTFSKFVDVEEFNIDGTEIKIIPSSSKYGKYDIKIGDEIIKGGETKKKAGESNNNNAKLSKFFGDFIQILSVISTQESINSTSGTGDAIMGAMSLFIQKYVIKNQNPKLILDTSYTSGKNNIIIYGFSQQFKSNYVRNKTLSPTNKTGITRRHPHGQVNNKGINQPAKRTRPPSAQEYVSVAKRVRPLTPVRGSAPSRNNTAEMPSQRQRVVKRVRSTTANSSSNSQISVKRKKLIMSNASSGITKRGSPNSITQTRSSNGKVVSVMRTVSAKPESIMKTASPKPESIMRTMSARSIIPNTSNSARSTQTQS